MKKTALIVFAILIFICGRLSAQCTPVSCLPTNFAFGGMCDTVLINATVNTAYSDFESFHATTNCFSGGVVNPFFSAYSAVLISMQSFSFTGLPTGLSGSTNAALYTAPAVGCMAFDGIPTEIGVFDIQAHLTLNATLYFTNNCSGFSNPVNNLAYNFSIDLTVLPVATFTGPSGIVCTTDGVQNLSVTGTPGGTFSGPGVSGNTFNPATAGPGSHTITYTISAQQGAAVAPATANSSLTVVVVSPVNYYVDGDNDSYGDASASPVSFCTLIPPAGYSLNNLDCDDNNNTVYPEATELCDGIDNDCDLLVDDSINFITYYEDLDGDMYGNSAVTQSSCNGIIGWVMVGGDCNDNNSAIHPGATEICDGLDNDCVGGIDDGLTFITYYEDVDGDMYGNASVSQSSCSVLPGYVTIAGDCDDNNAAINPGATEICDGLDNDCAGGIDNGLVFITYYEDLDADTYGNSAVSQSSCNTVAGYVIVGGDCDDNNSAVHPGATEVCDDVDNDCAGGIDNGLTFITYYLDADSDTYGSPDSSILSCVPIGGYVTNNTDCNDAANSIYPGATDILGNSVDENCDGADGVLGLESLAGLSLKVFPNPASDVVIIKGDLNANVQVRLLNLSGAVVLQNNFVFVNTHQLNVSGLTPGNYILAITNLDMGQSGYMRIVIAR